MSPSNGIPNGWAEWSKFVLKAIERLEDADAARTVALAKSNAGTVIAHAELVKELAKIKAEIAALQVKAGIWGAAAGAIPVIIMLIINAVK